MSDIYSRSGKVDTNREESPLPFEEEPIAGTGSVENKEEDRIYINGFQQVLEMLKIAEPDFRESLLNRIAQQDPDLAINLRAGLKREG